MKNALRWACQDLRRFLQLDEANRQQFLYAPATAFTRCRQLTFERTAVLVLSLLKTCRPVGTAGGKRFPSSYSISSGRLSWTQPPKAPLCKPGESSKRYSLQASFFTPPRYSTAAFRPNAGKASDCGLVTAPACACQMKPGWAMPSVGKQGPRTARRNPYARKGHPLPAQTRTQS